MDAKKGMLLNFEYTGEGRWSDSLFRWPQSSKLFRDKCNLDSKLLSDSNHFTSVEVFPGVGLECEAPITNRRDEATQW